MLRKVLMPFCLAGALAVAGGALAQTPQGTAGASGQQIKRATTAATMGAAPKSALLDINSASKDELKALKGVGDKRADDIIKGRPYKSKDELARKKVIPQGVYNGIKDKIIAKQG